MNLYFYMSLFLIIKISITLFCIMYIIFDSLVITFINIHATTLIYGLPFLLDKTLPSSSIAFLMFL